MLRTYWHADNSPIATTFDKLLYDIRKDDGADGLIFDAVSFADIIEDAEGRIALDAMLSPYNKLDTKMGILQKVMERAGTEIKPVSQQLSEPFTQNGTANVACIFELSDGQTISVFFHNPDTTPKKIMPTDEMVSWKWLLNKKDITIVVAPEKGKDLNVRQVATRLMKLAEKNSPAFQRTNAKRAEKMQALEGLKTEVSWLEKALKGKQHELEVAKIEAEDRASAVTNKAYSNVVEKVIKLKTLIEVAEKNASADSKKMGSLTPPPIRNEVMKTHTDKIDRLNSELEKAQDELDKQQSLTDVPDGKGVKIKLTTVTGKPAKFEITKEVEAEVNRFLTRKFKQLTEEGTDPKTAAEMADLSLKYWVQDINDGQVGEFEGSDVGADMKEENDWIESKIASENNTLGTTEQTQATPEVKVTANMIEYITQDVFKGKSLKSAINKFIKKFNGQNNMFLGGLVNVTFDALMNEYIKNHCDDVVKLLAQENTPVRFDIFTKSTSEKFGIDLQVVVDYCKNAINLNPPSIEQTQATPEQEPTTTINTNNAPESLKPLIDKINTLFSQAAEKGLNPISKEQFMTDVANGNRRGFSLETLKNHKAETLKLIADLASGKTTPRKIVGVGGTKATANKWLNGQLNEDSIAIESGGFLKLNNLYNYEAYLRDLIKNGQDTSFESDDEMAKKESERLEKKAIYDEKIVQEDALLAANKSYSVGDDSDFKRPLALKFTISVEKRDLFLKLLEAVTPQEKYEVLISNENNAKMEQQPFGLMVDLNGALRKGIKFGYFKLQQRAGYSVATVTIDLASTQTEVAPVEEQTDTVEFKGSAFEIADKISKAERDINPAPTKVPRRLSENTHENLAARITPSPIFMAQP